ncbi:hypothetical protein GGI00_000524, partial [Coemansia sp. RSA 2681]
MVSLANTAALLAVVLTVGCQMAHATPQPQIQGTIVPKAAPAVGDTCDINKDRLICADETTLIVCDRNEWVEYSKCTQGTVCRNGYCDYPEAGGSSPAPTAPAAPTAKSSSAAVPPPSAGQSQLPSPSGSKPASASGVGQPTSAAAKPSASAAQPSSAAPSSSAGGGNDNSSGGGGGSGGDNFGITCDKFTKAVSAASSAIGNSYPAPSNAQCTSFLKGMKSAGSIASSREAAMFLANILWESDGLRAKEEYDCKTLPDWCAQNYKTPEDVAGQTYWGRGYIQLSWHYNYLDASKGLFGDDRLAKDPAQ